MMAKGEDESWFRTKDDTAAAMDHRDTMSVRVSNLAQDMAAKRPYSVQSTFSDGEDNRWSPRGGRRMGESFSVEGATARARGRPNLRRSHSTFLDQAAVVLCCCSPRWGRSKYNAMEGNGNEPEDVLRTKGRWEVDADDEFYKPPVWKQIILKVKAQARQANCGGTNTAEWVNYDSQSYEKNFDDGLWRDTSRTVFQENVENENLGLKERALHTALLTKFASSRPHKLADADIEEIMSDPDLSPLPVRSAMKPNDDFVPIWQRRATSPVTLDVRQRS